MNFTFLGTSAVNAYPEAFCKCKNCERARELGGPSLRKRSAALINDDLLIDFGPDIMSAAALHNRPLTRVRYCLQTHAHADHLDPSHFLSRSPEYGVVGAPRLHFFASHGSLEVTAELLQRDCAPDGFLSPQIEDRLNLAVHQIEPMQRFIVGSYHITAFPANHDPFVDPLLYSIEENGRSIFYGTDTAEFSEDVWQLFHEYKLKFDLVVLDHTYGPHESGSDHLSAYQFIQHISRMREEGLMKTNARALATHISHPGNPVHPELSMFAEQNGYEIAFDGLVASL